MASEPHRARAEVSALHAVHVIARVVPAARGLRRRGAYRAIRRALVVTLARSDFRIVSLAVRAHRLELIVEADDRISLARGMQGFQVAAAKHLNRGLGRRGAVFPDRYRASSLITRAAMRAVLEAHRWQRVGWPETWTLRAYVDSLSGSPGPALVSAWSAIRYSSPSHLPRSTR